MLNSETQAEELEKKAKIELKNKNYELALSLFEAAKKIYTSLNFRGKIAFIEKKITQLKRVIQYEKQKEVIKKPDLEKKTLEDDIAIKPSEAFSKKMLEIKKNIIMSERDLTLAEIRRSKLREKAEEMEKKEQRDRIGDIRIREREEQKKKELQEYEEKFKLDDEKAKEVKILKEKADQALEQAKMAVKYKKFNEAKKHYKEAIDFFKDLGWFDQVDNLYQEIKNVENYKVAHLRKSREEATFKTKREIQFQKRVNNVLAEKKKEEEKKQVHLETFPPEIKKIIEKTKLLKEKAEKEEKTNIQRAISRYQYILELYKTVPNDKLNLTNDITEIEKKIAELEAKM